MGQRLKLLMKIFNISNSDLARLLKIDASLVSKWRSGSRSISSNASYVRRLSDYVLSIDRKTGYKNIRQLLADYDIPANADENELSLYLASWLNDPVVHSHQAAFLEEMSRSRLMSRIDQLYYWEGREGRREAVKHFTQYAINLSPDQEILSYTTESNLWFQEDPAFLRSWTELIHEFFEKGNVMRIIHPVNRNYHDIAQSMGKWLPLHLSGEVRGYYQRYYDETELVKITILALAGHISLFSISTDESPSSECKTWTVTDSALAESLEKVVRRHLKQSVSLFHRFNMEHPEDHNLFLDHSLSMFDPARNCYFYNDFNQMIPEGRDERISFFSGTGIASDSLERFLTILETIDKLKRECECYYFLDTDTLIRFLKEPLVQTNILSLYADKELYIPGERFRESIIRFLERSLERDNIHVCIVDDITQDFKDLTICTGGDRNVHTFAAGNRIMNTFCMEIKEPTVAMAVNQEMNHLWRRIPYSHKDKEYILDYMKKLFYER